MRCQDCDRPADVEIESGGVIVGLCRRHLRARVEALADGGPIAALREAVDAEEA